MSNYEVMVRRMDGSPPALTQISELELFAIQYALGVARRAVESDILALLGDAPRVTAKELVSQAREVLHRVGLSVPDL